MLSCLQGCLINSLKSHCLIMPADMPQGSVYMYISDLYYKINHVSVPMVVYNDRIKCSELCVIIELQMMCVHQKET